MTQSQVSQIEVRRSRRRTRTVSAFEEGGRVVVAIPAHLSTQDERYWVDRMVERRERSRRRRSSDTALAGRARELSARYLDSRARPASVSWTSNQNTRWGSCTPSRGTIRISDQVQPMPRWVQDYVLLHELVHLLVPGHGPDFWTLVERYPDMPRARGFLDGVAFAQRQVGGEVDDGAQSLAQDEPAGDEPAHGARA